MNLTAHFTLEELIASDYAIRHNIRNMPDDAAVLENLHTLAKGLERVRAVIGKPIHVNSGYRSPAVNAAIGGSDKSQHKLGLAADIVVPGITARELAMTIVAARDSIDFDQCIYEGTWVHVSFDVKPRRQVLTALFPGPRYVQGIA